MDGKKVSTGMKVALAAVATGAMVLPLAACGGGDKATTADGKPILNVTVVKHSLTKPMKEMQWTKDLEKACGCSIKWSEVSSDWDQKKQAMLAGSNIPDVAINAFNQTDMATYGTLFEDLSDDLDSMPNVKEMFDKDKSAEQLVTNLDGKVYTLPSNKGGWYDPTWSNIFVNKQWLDKLGLEVPTTWDELHDVLVAFKEQDPNGNGQADEIPMDWAPVSTTGFGDYQPTLLLGSEGIVTVHGGQQGYFAEDGEIKNFLVDERYKDLIEFLNTLWSEGLVSDKVFTQDYSQFQSVARGEGDTAKVGFTWGSSLTDRFGTEMSKQYISIGQLKKSADQTTPIKYDWFNDQSNYSDNAIAISAKASDKQAALKFADAFYDPDISIQAMFGDFGKDVEKTGEMTYKVLPPADSSKDSSTWKWTETLADNAPMWLRPDFKLEQKPQDWVDSASEMEPLQPALNNIDKDKDVLPFALKFTSDEQNTISLNNTTILNTAMTKFGQWVTKGGVDAEWDEYVKTIEQANLQANLDLYQKAYDTYKEQTK